MIALSAAVTLAAQGSSRTMLRLRLSDRSLIAVELDGRFIDRKTSSLTLDGLRPGLHRVEVYHTDEYHRRPVRIYTGTIRLKAGTVSTGIVDVRRRMLRMRTEMLDEQDDRAYSDRDAPGSSDRDNPFDDRDRDRDIDEPREDASDLSANSGSGVKGNPGEPGLGSFPKGRGNSQPAGQPAGTLPQRKVNELAARVNKLITDTDKESLMKTELKKYRISIAQVQKMLGWLAFESTRLDFAIWAYAYTTDREAFRKLEDAFELKTNKAEFRKAIPLR